MKCEPSLEQQLEQLGRVVARGPSLKQAVLAELEGLAAPSKSLSLGRRLMRSPITRIAAAVLILIGCYFGARMWRDTSSLVLADVFTNLQQMDAFSFRTQKMVLGQDQVEKITETLVSNIWGKKVKGWRVDPNSGEQILSMEMNMLPLDQKSVVLQREHKIGLQLEVGSRQAQAMWDEIPDPCDMLQRVQHCRYHSLGQSTLEGVEVEGFQTTDPNYLDKREGQVDVKIWVDVHTQLPVRLEESIVWADGTRRHVISDQFRWHVPVNRDMFELVIPEDYISMGTTTVADPQEGAALAGLRWILENEGRYPPDLESISFTIVPELTIEMPEGLTQDEQKAFLLQAMQDGHIRMTMGPTKDLVVFRDLLKSEDRDPVYYGDSVTPEDAQAVLWRWRTDVGTYRVVMGDLSLREVSRDELKLLEAHLLALRQSKRDDVESVEARPPAKLLAWWRFNQPDASVARDEQGLHDGTLVNMNHESWITGVEGSALHFDGVDDYVEIPRLIQDSWTVSFWMRTSTQGPKRQWGWWDGQGLVDGEVKSPCNDFGTALVEDKVCYGVAARGQQGTSLYSKTSVCDSQWHYVAATRDTRTGRMELYLEGVLEAEGSGTRGPKDDPPVLCIGRLQTGVAHGYFQGDIDEVQLYDGVLSQDDIHRLYQSQLP